MGTATTIDPLVAETAVAGAVELSLVVPVFNEADVLDRFFARVVPIVEAAARSYEIVCVDDGSRDDTVRRLRAHRACNPHVKVVALSRNFGKEAALSAGLDLASGDAVIPLDADLQDPPELIPTMLAKWRDGYDVVLARRVDRRADSAAKRISAGLFYRAINLLSEVPIPSNVGDFRLLDRRAVEVLRRMPERMRFMKGLFAWLGFGEAVVEYTRPARAAGDTKWSFWRLWNLGISGIVSFSTVPLRIWTYIGVSTACLAMLYMLYIVARTLISGTDVPGYASLVALILFFSGVNMIGLGILGEYLGRVFVEVKQRPLYVVAEALGFEEAAPPTRGGARGAAAGIASVAAGAAAQPTGSGRRSG